MKKLSIALKLWGYIATFMTLVIFADFILFMDFMQYSNLYFYIKEIFIGLFILTIIISFFIVNLYFHLFGIDIKAKNKFLKMIKIYFGILWRAILILIPIIAFIAYKYQGSIQSRIWTIIIEIFVGFPAIWWFLSSKKILIK